MDLPILTDQHIRRALSFGLINPDSSYILFSGEELECLVEEETKRLFAVNGKIVLEPKITINQIVYPNGSSYNAEQGINLSEVPLGSRIIFNPFGKSKNLPTSYRVLVIQIKNPIRELTLDQVSDYLIKK